MSASPLPSFVPYNATDAQMLQLIGQLQDNQMPPGEALLLGILFSLPIPESWFPIQDRIAWFYSHGSSNAVVAYSNQHPLTTIFLIGFWPIILIVVLVFLYFLIKTLISGIQLLIPILFSRFIPSTPVTILELTFPANTSKSAYATSQLYTLLHNLARQSSFWERFLNIKSSFSLEIVSTRDQGIRYILVIPQRNSAVIKRSLISYLPGIKVKEVDDYTNTKVEPGEYYEGIAELKLTNYFALPLSKQTVLEEHDPISYLTGNMTKLDKGELIAFQVVTTPILSKVHKKIIKKTNELRSRIYKGKPLTPILNETIFQKIGSLPGFVVLTFFLKIIWGIFSFVLMIIQSVVVAFIDPNGKTIPLLMAADAMNDRPASKQELLNPYEKEIQELIRDKINQNLYETSIRILIRTKDPDDFDSRISGLMASFGPMESTYQSFTAKSSFLPFGISNNQRVEQFRRRVISPSTSFNQNPILSTSEITDLYHFPYTDTTKTEDLLKLHSKELPAPLSLKDNNNLDVVFGKNNYGEQTTPIGLTKDERVRHSYIIGATGTGKTTLLLSMINQDLQNGKGVCVVDPHGDLAESVINCIPDERIKDLIYFNPFDIKFPIGVNLLELTPGLDEDELLLEKEFITESVISLFRKVFSDAWSAHPHRIEYILRNTIHTAFTLENPTLFTIFDLLNNPVLQKKVVAKLQDEDLKNFWKYEFGKAGDYQKVKMVAPVTARIGRFLFSPSARRILEQEKSTINFDEILDNKKILICNLAKGNIGEDTSEIMGIMILNKIQLAALKRARIEKENRNDFYLYVDEFQNFATPSFVQMLSEARKYGLSLTMAEQSTSQQKDRNLVDIILANTGTIVIFRSANPSDEQLLLPQFSPYVAPGEIMNLPSFHFYIKKAAIIPEEPFSGETIPVKVTKELNRWNRFIKSSRDNYAIVYSHRKKNAKVAERIELDPEINVKPHIKTGLPA